MKRDLAVASLFLLLGLWTCALVGCSTAPKGPTQTVYTAGWTLVAATNAVADLKASGQLKGDDLFKAKDLLDQANMAYINAKASLVQGKQVDATNYIVIVQTLLNQLAVYLQAHGAK